MYKLLSGRYQRVLLLAISSEAEGEHKDGDPQPTFPESISVATRYMANLKPAPQAEAPG